MQHKYLFHGLAFYDHTRIQTRLEEMAARGWMIDKMGNLLWRFRPIEPRPLHFSVTYFPNASEYDPGPTDGELTKLDFCAQDGWLLAVRWGPMQIFYNAQEEPVPIETDPVTRVANIRQAMRRNLFPSMLLSCAMMVYVLVFYGSMMFRDPISFFAAPYNVFCVPVFLLTLCCGVYELIFYLRWGKNAAAAAENGVFLPISISKPLHRFFLVLIYTLVLLGLLSSARSYLTYFLANFVLVCGAVFLANALRNWLKKRGASRRTNFLATTGLIVAVSLVGTALVVALAVSGMLPSTSESKIVGTYEHYGMEFNIYDDPLPLTLEELMPELEGDYSRKADIASSPLLSRREYLQRPLLSDHNELPELRYTLVDVRFQPLYRLCRNHLMELDEVDREVFLLQYLPLDAAAYGCVELYQRYYETDPDGDYLIFWEDRMAELSCTNVLTPEQLKQAIAILAPES